MASAPKRGDAGLAARLCPPKRLFGLVNNITPGKTDIMHVALGPLGQFAALALAVAPHVEGLAELGQNAGTMMIYHRLL
jgi:hypothetical protein